MKLERLIGILAILLQQEKVTAPALAELFEVSPRTIRRDVEALCQAGIPLVTTQGAGGGISILEGYRVDRTLLTAPEMQAILAGPAEPGQRQRHPAVCPADGEALRRVGHPDPRWCAPAH